MRPDLIFINPPAAMTDAIPVSIVIAVFIGEDAAP